MNRYEKQNAAHRINDYYDLRPHEAALGKNVEAFERAKAETLKNMRDALAQTEAMTFAEFHAERKAERGFERLTSAAPKLLAALEMLKEAVEFTPLGTRGITAVEHARAVIASATQAPNAVSEPTERR